MDGDDPNGKPWLAPADTCQQLRRMSASRGTRTIFEGRRKKWRPGGIRDPRTDDWFTPDGAWSFIEELLETGVDVEQRLLEIPVRKKAFVFFGRCAEGRLIYIKLQFSASRVVGRSFHISTAEEDENDD